VIQEDDNEGYDWNQEEEVPERLRKKWQAREGEGPREVVCHSCGKNVQAESLLCVYCGKRTGVKAGLFSHLRMWLFESFIGVVVFVAILLSIFLFLIF